MSRKPKDEDIKKKEILHFRTTEDILKRIIQEVGERTMKQGRTYTKSELIEEIIVEYFHNKS